MLYVAMWALLGALVGSFGTAYVHQQTGRDVTMGGILGLLVGAIGSIIGLVMFWVWLYYSAPPSIGRMYGTRRKVWYRWWD